MVEINVNELANLRISQYKAGSPIGQLISVILSDFQAREVDPLLELADWHNSGVMLDWLGELLGLPRPLLNVNALPVFGFRGTSFGEGGFDDPAFITVTGSTPMPDAQYLVCLRAKYLQLRGTASLENMLNVYGDRGTPTFIQATDELDGTVTVRFLDDTDKLVWDRMWDIGVAPIPAGIEASSVKVSSF